MWYVVIIKWLRCYSKNLAYITYKIPHITFHYFCAKDIDFGMKIILLLQTQNGQRQVGPAGPSAMPQDHGLLAQLV